MKCADVGVLLFLGIVITSCAAKPRADIGMIRQPSDLSGRETDTYAFPRTYVDIAPAANATVSITTRNVSYEAFRVAVRPKSSPGVRTHLSLAKKENTDLLQSAGVEVIDQRIKLIQDIASIVKGVIGFGVLDASADLPVILDTLALMPDNRNASGQRGEDQQVRYWFGPVQPDAKRIEELSLPQTANGLIYAACREMRIEFMAKPGQDTRRFQHTTFAADPRYYRFVAFPAKGMIKFHDQCGVSVITDKDAAVSSDTAVLLTVLKELGDIKKELEKDEQ